MNLAWIGDIGKTVKQLYSSDGSNKTAALVTATVCTGLYGNGGNEMTEAAAIWQQQQRQDGSSSDTNGANWTMWRRRQRDDRDDG